MRNTVPIGLSDDSLKYSRNMWTFIREIPKVCCAADQPNRTQTKVEEARVKIALISTFFIGSWAKHSQKDYKGKKSSLGEWTRLSGRPI